jgi:hypothetical protein
LLMFAKMSSIISDSVAIMSILMGSYFFKYKKENALFLFFCPCPLDL